MTEREENEFINECIEIVENAIEDNVYKFTAPAEKILKGEIKVETEEDLDAVLIDANKSLYMYIPDTDERYNEIYNEYSYKKFKTGGGDVYVARGKEDKSIHPK